jgi:hypothetical protein
VEERKAQWKANSARSKQRNTNSLWNRSFPTISDL